MANGALQVRLSAIMHAYLQDLSDIGYGKDKTAVARRFIENAVTRALETKVIEKRRKSDVGGNDSGDDD